MIFWILVVLVIGITVFTAWDTGEFLLGFLTLFISTMIALFLFVGIAFFVPTSKVEAGSWELKSMGTSSSVKGSMFLGTGSFEGEQRISFITHSNEDTSVALTSVSSDDSIIFEDDSVTPHVVVYENTFDSWWYSPSSVAISKNYEFYVPTDSVSNEFEVTP